MTVKLTLFAQTPEPPYFAAIFSSQRTEGDAGYAQMAEHMFDLAAMQQGFLGAESVRNADGFGITVSYWSSEEAIIAWKQHAAHQQAQQAGKRMWYANYQIRIAKVERAYGKRPSEGIRGESGATEQHPLAQAMRH